MWTSCPRLLDEPAKVLGMELGDFGLLMVLPLFLRPFLHVLLVFAVTAAIGAVLTRAKRGQPHGALPHLLHGLELFPWPGVLRPALVSYTPWHLTPLSETSPWRRLIGLF